MSKHSLARVVAIVLLVLAVIIMVGGVLSALIFGSRGFGSGWSEGSNIWFTLPVMALSCSTGFGLLLLGAVLLLLVDISRNLSETKVVIQQPAAVEALACRCRRDRDARLQLAAAAGVAAGVVATEAVEPVAAALTTVAVERSVQSVKPRKRGDPRMAAADDVVVVAETMPRRNRNGRSRRYHRRGCACRHHRRVGADGSGRDRGRRTAGGGCGAGPCQEEGQEEHREEGRRRGDGRGNRRRCE